MLWTLLWKYLLSNFIVHLYIISEALFVVYSLVVYSLRQEVVRAMHWIPWGILKWVYEVAYLNIKLLFGMYEYAIYWTYDVLATICFNILKKIQLWSVSGIKSQDFSGPLTQHNVVLLKLQIFSTSMTAISLYKIEYDIDEDSSITPPAQKPPCCLWQLSKI